MWPSDAESLVAYQERLGAQSGEAWSCEDLAGARVGACWVCFPRGLSGPGSEHDPAWISAVAMVDGRLETQHTARGTAGPPYVPGLMALRVGPLLEAAVLGLSLRPDVLLLDATARDHPRRAGLALHLGAELDLPTIGVTHRPLLATGPWPTDQSGATSLLQINQEVVGCWLRTHPHVRPLAIHPGWRVDLSTAVWVVMAVTTKARTPEPLRQARHLARRARNRNDLP